MITLDDRLKLDIQNFVYSDRRNQWYYHKEVDYYLRKSIRTLHGARKCIDLANISVNQSFQRRGISKAILRFMEEEVNNSTSLSAIYVENTQNPEWIEFLVRDGFLLYDNLYPPSYIKIVRATP